MYNATFSKSFYICALISRRNGLLVYLFVIKILTIFMGLSKFCLWEYTAKENEKYSEITVIFGVLRKF